MIYKLLFSLFMALSYQLAYGLDNDTEQPATLDADDMEMDFNSGLRVYRGNVVFRQGSIKMTCDELTTRFSSDGDLDEAICVGSPGQFKQRPEGQTDDTVGTANSITLNRVNDLVTLKSRAKVVQGDSTIKGKLITYNLVTEKASVKGGGSQSSSTNEASTSTESGQESSESAVEEDTSRPSLVIQPRKKKVVEERATEASTE